jgi:hypothetical protein
MAEWLAERGSDPIQPTLELGARRNGSAAPYINLPMLNALLVKMQTFAYVEAEPLDVAREDASAPTKPVLVQRMARRE